MARDGLRKIARELKARGPRMDGSLLSGWAMRLFRGKPLEDGPGDRLRDWDAVAVRARRERPQGDARPAGSAGEDLLGAGAWVRIISFQRENHQTFSRKLF